MRIYFLFNFVIIFFNISLKFSIFGNIFIITEIIIDEEKF
jgi:hypothetical protein